MEDLSVSLGELYQNNEHNLVRYWQSYLEFYRSIFYLQMKDEKKAEKAVEKGIDWMEEMTNKGSEDYALLAMMTSFSIQFKSFIKIPKTSGKAKEWTEKAIAMDTTNLRAYYVFASHDFYTPKAFGGGKKAEEYLLKAISLPSQKVKNPVLPSWGKSDAYHMLISLYLREDKKELAREYYRKAVSLYPQNSRFHEFKAQFD